MGCLCWSRCLELCITLCLKRPSLNLLDSIVQEVWAICCRLEYFLHYWLEKAWGALCATFYQCLTDQAFSCLIHFFERCVSDLLLSYRSGHKLWQNPSKIGSSLKACSSALESPNSNWSTHEAPSVLQLQTLFSSLLRQRSVEAGNEQKPDPTRTRVVSPSGVLYQIGQCMWLHLFFSYKLCLAHYLVRGLWKPGMSENRTPKYALCWRHMSL